MDLSTMETELESSNYATWKDFVKHANFIFSNCPIDMFQRLSTSMQFEALIVVQG